MNFVLKSLGEAVAFMCFDAAITIFFDHAINYKNIFVDFAIFFVVILMFNYFAPKLRKKLGFEKTESNE